MRDEGESVGVVGGDVVGVELSQMSFYGRAARDAVGVDAVDGDHAGEEVCGEEVASCLVGVDVAGVGLQLHLANLCDTACFRVDSEAEDAAVAVVPDLLIEGTSVGRDAELPGLCREIDVVLEGELPRIGVHGEDEESSLLGEGDVDKAPHVRHLHRTVKEYNSASRR